MNHALTLILSVTALAVLLGGLLGYGLVALVAYLASLVQDNQSI